MCKIGSPLLSFLLCSLCTPLQAYVLDKTTEMVRNALLLYPSIADETISHGRAAELLGISKMELIELYGSLGIPYLDMTDEEFEEEIQMVKKIAGKLS